MREPRGGGNPPESAVKVKAGPGARRGESRSGPSSRGRAGSGASSTDPLPPSRGWIRVRALLLRPERW